MGRAYEVRKASIQKTGAAKAKLYSMYAREIYDIAKKVVIPAIISMLTFVFLSFNLNNFSISVKK